MFVPRRHLRHPIASVMGEALAAHSTNNLNEVTVSHVLHQTLLMRMSQLSKHHSGQGR